MKIGFTCGAFDLCHYGHILMFKECASHCDVLIVGVQSDPSIDRKEKNKPVQSLEERIGQVSAVRWVDKVITYDTEADLYELLQRLQPDIRFIGCDWKGKKFTGCDLPIEVHYNERDHSYSTSELRRRVAKHDEHK